MAACYWCWKKYEKETKGAVIHSDKNFCSTQCGDEYVEYREKSLEARKKWRQIKKSTGELLDKFNGKIEELIAGKIYVTLRSKTALIDKNAVLHRVFEKSMFKQDGFKFDTVFFTYAIFQVGSATVARIIPQYRKPSKKVMDILNSINPDELAGFSIDGRTKSKATRRRKQNG